MLMTTGVAMPTQDEFLAASVETIAAVAPHSMVYAPGGTRRSAAFDGIDPRSKEYARLLQDNFVACLEVIFRYGVTNVFTPMLMMGHTQEVDDIENDLIRRVGQMMTDPHLIKLFLEHGWRLRIVPSDYEEVFRPYLEFLETNTPHNAPHTWWITCTLSYESWWSQLISLAKSEQVTTRTDMIRVMFGEEIAPITLCVSFGKFMISPDLFPPLLMDNVQCYWSQQVGFSLTDLQFRKVLYDYAYLRRTWQKDKTARAKVAQADRSTWEQENILGLGKRIGPFWYPLSLTIPSV